MGRRKRTQADLALRLGLSQAMVSRLVARGMPLDIPKAQEWRRSNLDQSFTKENRRVALPPATDAGSELLAQQLGLVRGLMELADADFERWAERLRAAMRTIPPRWRDRVELPIELWDRLVGPAIDTLAKYENAGDTGASDADADDSDDLVGRFFYAVAAGEARVLDPDAAL